jgi:hypothetical protein
LNVFSTVPQLEYCALTFTTNDKQQLIDMCDSTIGQHGAWIVKEREERKEKGYLSSFNHFQLPLKRLIFNSDNGDKVLVFSFTYSCFPITFYFSMTSPLT